MDRSCCVLGCRFNYTVADTSVFKFPEYQALREKQIRNILRENFELRDQTVKHIETRFMVRKHLFSTEIDEDKIYKVADRLIMGVCGEAGDTTQYAEYIAKNMQLYKMRNGYELSPCAAANFTRGNLAEYLRTRSPYNVNMLLAGYSDEKGPQLYFLDYLASMHEMRFTSHGYGGMFSLSIMDRYYKKDMTVEEGYELLKKCVREIKKRFVVNLPNFTVKLVDKDGVRVLPPITQKDLILEDTKKSEREK